ncbi:hypothetical protein BN14_10049 [Rhizoctonia solani AG-1 IB]|uniref:Uncharacterized protein n=1 Tax=Thanatephorus cucumeris (strain AG1-IB / isolate 7/3/14) TaxID=1108050 RepID=M5C7I8_THACB|nr:hypothetical protein BN14_10049 [Rhizoctonia solani AG-1 IB]
MKEVEVVVPYQDGPGREPSRGSLRSQRTQPSSGAASAAYRPNRNYEPGAPGTRAIDDYYNNTAPTAASLAAANTYPPQPQPQRQPSQPTQRQASIGQPHRQASSHSANYDPYAQTQYNAPSVPSIPQGYSSPPTRSADPYAAMPQHQHQTHADPYLAIAGAIGGTAAGAGHAGNRGHSTDSYNHQQYPSSSHEQYSSSPHQQFPSASQQYTQTQGHQDPYAGSSYNPQAAVMAPPQPTHYQDNSHSGYQGYDGHQQGYDPYTQQQQRDPYTQQQGYDSHAQQQQGYDSYGQQQQGYDSYGQQGYESYPNEGSRSPNHELSWHLQNVDWSRHPAQWEVHRTRLSHHKISTPPS